MKRQGLTILLLLAVLTAFGQKPKQELKNNLCLSASNFLAYRGPLQPRLTPAPEGMTPF